MQVVAALGADEIVHVLHHAANVRVVKAQRDPDDEGWKPAQREQRSEPRRDGRCEDCDNNRRCPRCYAGENAQAKQRDDAAWKHDNAASILPRGVVL